MKSAKVRIINLLEQVYNEKGKDFVHKRVRNSLTFSYIERIYKSLSEEDQIKYQESLNKIENY